VSEYYEFQTVDRRLTAEEMDELRAYSTRARITPTSFVNDYSWGHFKGDVDGWMERYFDAFLYLANWGTHLLKLRLPSRLLSPATARAYCSGGSAFVQEAGGQVILTFVSEDEDDGEWVEGEGQLSAMISVRTELARGDLRAIYLGWLLRAQIGELTDESVEPPIPPGLGQLSPSLESLAEFLRIDGDLLHVAAEASRPLADARLDRDEVRTWIGELMVEEKDELITDLIMVDAGSAWITELLQRFLKQRSTEAATAPPPKRTVGQLLRAADVYAEECERIESERQVEENACRKREVAIAREKHLVGRESKLWAQVNLWLRADSRGTTIGRWESSLTCAISARGVAPVNSGGGSRCSDKRTPES